MKKIILMAFIGLIATSSIAQIADSAKRHVVLQGGSNFRDLGGYTTKDGHHVKWNEIYRSADMSKLTEADLAVLRDRKITFDVDLRGVKEAASAPDKLNPGTDYTLCPAGSNNSMNDWMKSITSAKGNAGDSLMIVYYSKIDSLPARYKPFFDKVLNLPPNQALVFHCTAGKDRTGIGAALLLYSLGVPYETIMQDYLASNYYRETDNTKMVNQMVKFAHIDEQVAKSMASVKKEDLDTTFNAIIKQYGSINKFLKDAIGLDKKKIALLKRKFLE